MRDFSNKVIVITGATSGIGLKLTNKLASMKARLILVGRSEQKLLKLQEDLRKQFQVNSDYYRIDLLDRTKWQTTLAQIINHYDRIDAVINNAGFGVFDYAVATDPIVTEQMFQLNVLALIEATRQFIPVFQAQNFGHLINIASFAGKLATPKSAVYSATKHAVLGYTNAVRLEIEQKNIYVTAVNLGPVRTAFFQQADPNGDYQKAISSYMLDPDYVADQIIRYLFRRKREINLPKWMAVGAKLHHQFPQFIERVMRGAFNKK
ncbi:SDR family NAD(P)-dependent oxidoreductase [Amphibacillus sediminis]|uniref:SDR family NAD(P)-dependent oxidoreductase n=1 Tax=Amphibacillus sediminis TaxID=360185 RepID=UPI00082BCACD|nr:SDR family oxidoreductase [Amphibacillus sediminis]